MDVGEGRKHDAEALEVLIYTCKLGFGILRRSSSSIPGVDSGESGRRGIDVHGCTNAAIAGCKRAALWYLFVAVDKKVLGAVAEDRGGSSKV